MEERVGVVVVGILLTVIAQEVVESLWIRHIGGWRVVCRACQTTVCMSVLYPQLPIEINTVCTNVMLFLVLLVTYLVPISR